MKLVLRIGVLLVLAASFFSLNHLQRVEARVSCPERDACYDAAYSAHVQRINEANQTYSFCVEIYGDVRDSCLDSAESTYDSCTSVAASNYISSIIMCSYGDPYDYRDCERDAQSAYWNEVDYCMDERQDNYNQCHSDYGQNTQECSNTFYDSAFMSEAELMLDRNACDLLCP